MTKYILAGGADRDNDEYGKELASEVLAATGPNPRVLSCCFAALREDWEQRFAEYSPWFQKHFGNSVTCELAMPAMFKSQARCADVIYVHGGDDTLLKYWLKQFDLVDLFRNKVVVGSSAGADALAHSYWTCDWREVQLGLGLVPCNVIPHYQSKAYGIDDPRGPINWHTAKAELEAVADNGYPVITLPEGMFKAFEV